MATGGKSKDKESKESSKKEKKGFKKGSSGASGGTEDVDTSEADLVALLATQAMKEEKKRLKPGLRQKKKGGKAINKKISELIFRLLPPPPFSLSHYLSH